MDGAFQSVHEAVPGKRRKNLAGVTVAVRLVPQKKGTRRGETRRSTARRRSQPPPGRRLSKGRGNSTGPAHLFAVGDADTELVGVGPVSIPHGIAPDDRVARRELVGVRPRVPALCRCASAPPGRHQEKAARFVRARRLLRLLVLLVLE